jgi:hypothetical protein
MARVDQSKPQIDEVIGTAGELVEKNKNRLIVDGQENLGALTADSLRLKQIPLSLLAMPAVRESGQGCPSGAIFYARRIA